MPNIFPNLQHVSAVKGVSIALSARDAVALAGDSRCDVVLEFYGTRVTILYVDIQALGHNKTEEKAVSEYFTNRKDKREPVQDIYSLDPQVFRLRNVILSMLTEIAEHNSEYQHRTDPERIKYWQQIAAGDVPTPS